MFSLNKFVGTQSDHAINKIPTTKLPSLLQKICTPLKNEVNVEWNNHANKLFEESCYKKNYTTNNVISQSNNVPNMNFTSSVVMKTSTTPSIKSEHNIKEIAVGQSDTVFQDTKIYNSNIMDSSVSTGATNDSETPFYKNSIKSGNDQQIFMSSTSIANEAIVTHRSSESGPSQLNYNSKVIKISKY